MDIYLTWGLAGYGIILVSVFLGYWFQRLVIALNNPSPRPTPPMTPERKTKLIAQANADLNAMVRIAQTIHDEELRNCAIAEAEIAHRMKVAQILGQG